MEGLVPGGSGKTGGFPQLRPMGRTKRSHLSVFVLLLWQNFFSCHWVSVTWFVRHVTHIQRVGREQKTMRNA